MTNKEIAEKFAGEVRDKIVEANVTTKTELNVWIGRRRNINWLNQVVTEYEALYPGFDASKVNIPIYVNKKIMGVLGFHPPMSAFTESEIVLE